MLGICYPERLEVFFVCAFLLSSFAYQRTQHIKFAFIGLVSANVCIYLKETAFLLIGGFSFFYLLIYLLQAQTNNTLESFIEENQAGWYKRLAKRIRACDKKILTYHSLVCLSAMMFLVVYAVLVMPQIERFYERGSNFTWTFSQQLALTIRGLGNFVLNDSLITILVPALIFVRILQVVFYKKLHCFNNGDKSSRWNLLNPFWDSCLVASALCVVGYIKLGIFESYYLLPAYFMGIGGVIYAVKSTYRIVSVLQNILRGFIKWILKLSLAVCIVLYMFISIPQGVYTFTSLKNYGVVFHDTLKFMQDYIAKQTSKTDIYFDGIGRDPLLYNDWYLTYFIRYLNEVYEVWNFDIKTSLQNGINIKTNPDSPYTYLNNPEVSVPKSGDIIILTRASSNHIDETYIKQMQQKYKLIYKTERIGLPYISAKTLLKEFIYRLSNRENTDSNSINDSLFFSNRNYFSLPINNYVFLVE
ncbi:hypothetical protein [Helicobacter himalayensis]|uniref:hypothetical protein n=1 Tax=Helicobacter himalayensis TaxID=1591088 RepID=UPI000830B801|nr:hypothetical protein [Helicobacter himalayensis]